MVPNFSRYSEKVPYVSTNVYSKLLFRAIKTKDLKLLQNLIDDMDKVYSVMRQILPLKYVVLLLIS